MTPARVPHVFFTPAAGVETDERGFVRVDAYQQTSVPHVFAAGDVTGRLMPVPQAARSGFVAADAGRGRSRTPVRAALPKMLDRLRYDRAAGVRRRRSKRR